MRILLFIALPLFLSPPAAAKPPARPAKAAPACWGYTYTSDNEGATATVTECALQARTFTAKVPKCEAWQIGARRCTGAATVEDKGPYLYCLKTKAACEKDRAAAMTESAEN